ncbi:Bystin-domain-containing protein [Lipomyces tetrasporus]|uniref:Bystin-domain-containing protein n=1 Tax=Lipomyces tetrasporus TaxID=54092 RepID=A0AAD7VU26_9ASCO|nr:Bystin-domain-containing protein [Lipomyces tetrasporus]KAJ8101364.1 Bystin-domain-containing protein [Lipomyces tetrasporus]
MPKQAVKSAAKPTLARHEPLLVDYESAALGDGKLKIASRGKRRREDDDGLEDDEDEKFVDAALSRKILQIARDQQQEIDEEISADGNDRLRDDHYDDEDDGFEDYDEGDDEEEYAEFEEFQRGEMRGLELDDEDSALFEKFLPTALGGPGNGKPVTLADKIMERLQQHETEMKRQAKGKLEEPEFPPKVVEVYDKVGLLLSRYRSGKLPKAFKIIPALKNWEDVLFLTQPDSWSSNACYEATKLFVSSLKSKQSQRFLSDILLDRVRDDIRENKNLNYHLYRSLKKSLYKPAAFFKGFLFPLCESGTCTLREAIIVGSVISKVSIPALHSSAALLRLAEMETYSGANSLFMRVLIDKKYALPYKVIDGVVFHFLRFRSSTIETGEKSQSLPVLWHQALLAFAQRYKNDITEEQREALLDLVRLRMHPKISPEIRRELREGVVRDSMIE